MKLSINFLKDYVDIDANAEEYGDTMTMAGITLETVRYFGKETEKVVVGKIEKIEKHPDADKLVVCKVDVGAGAPIQIVTGADNIFEGAYVPVVLDGGRVVEQGTHDELIDQGGFYADLYNSQFEDVTA